MTATDMTDATTPPPDELLRETARLRSIARKLVRDATAADDVAQEAWLAALRTGRPWRRGWLAGVTAKLARRRARDDARRRRLDAAHADALGVPDGSEPGAGDAVERTWLRRRLLDAVLELPEPYRSAVALRYLDGLPPRAIARRNGVSAEVARQHVARGLAMLRERLDDDFGDRRAWVTALCAIGFPDRGALAVSTWAGGTVMSAKTTVAILAAGIALAAIVTWSAIAGFGSASPVTPRDAAGADRTADGPGTVAPREPAAVTEGSARASVAPVGALASADRERDLHGRVVGPDGAPIPGARLRVVRAPAAGYDTVDLDYSARREAVVDAVSDALGEFAIALSPGIPFELHAAHEGYAPAVLTSCYAGERVDVQLAPGATVYGRVVRERDGAPVVGASVRGTRSDRVSSVELFGGRTDSDGRFRFTGLSAGSVRVEITPRREATTRHSVDLVPGGEHELRIEVGSGFTVRGTVRDATTGAGIPGARVGQGWTMRKFVRTDAFGEYVIEGFAGSGYGVVATADGYGELRHELGHAENGVVVVDFELRPGRRVRGRVVDASARPIAGAYVAVVGVRIQRGIGSTDWRAAHTGADGRFEVDSLVPDLHHTVWVKKDGYATVAYDLPARARRESPFDVGTITLAPGATLRGRVVDADGDPVPDRYVRLQGTNADRARLAEGNPERLNSYVDSRSARTDDLGRFTFADLAAGAYRVEPRAVGGESSSAAAVRIAAGEDRRGVEVRVATGLSIEGRIVDDLGVPVAGAFLLGAPRGATTDADGRFTIGGLQAGTLHLQAFLSDDAQAARENRVLQLPPTPVEAGTSGIELVMALAAHIRGRVLDDRGGPAPNARVWAETGAGAFVSTAQTGPDGDFELLLAVGRTVVLFARHGRPDETVFIPAREEPGPRAHASGVRAGAEDVELRLPPRGR